MLVAQLVACHHAALECMRRAMLPSQVLEVRQLELGFANKLSRTYATMLEALDRHRGKGQQHVTVEHVHVHQGGQAIVGNVHTGGNETLEGLSHARAIPHAVEAEMRSPFAEERETVPVAGHEERPMQNARRNQSRGS